MILLLLWHHHHIHSMLIPREMYTWSENSVYSVFSRVSGYQKIRIYHSSSRSSHRSFSLHPNTAAFWLSSFDHNFWCLYLKSLLPFAIGSFDRSFWCLYPFYIVFLFILMVWWTLCFQLKQNLTWTRRIKEQYISNFCK